MKKIVKMKGKELNTFWLGRWGKGRGGGGVYLPLCLQLKKSTKICKKNKTTKMKRN